jgi:RNA polymerase sigma-70 factor (ECF subfamily)
MNTAVHAAVDPPLTDADLARRVAAGDEAAFRSMMRRHNQVLFRTARSILRDDAEAEDAVQESYLQAYRAMGSFRGDAKLATWLTRIVVNESLGRLRKTRRTAEVIPMSVDASDEGAAVAAKAIDPSDDQPERQALRGEVRRILEAGIDALPDSFRTVFVLRAVEEMSVEDAAASLGIPEATVRTRFFRARSLLRESLSRELDIATSGAFEFLGARCDRIVERVIARLHDPPPGGP